MAAAGSAIASSRRRIPRVFDVVAVRPDRLSGAFAAIAICVGLGGCIDRGSMLREWEGCLTREVPAPAVRICGTVWLRSSVSDTLRFTSQVRHSLPLRSLLVAPGMRLADAGTISRDGGRWDLQLGTAQPTDADQVMMAYDDGSIVADAEQRGPLLVGTWGRTCFLLGCPERGTIVLRRVKPEP
jgi:hypothetical protein